MQKIKDFLFVRKLNKNIKKFAAKAKIKDGYLIINIRGKQCEYPYNLLKSAFCDEDERIMEIVRQIHIFNVKEAYQK